MQAKIICRTVAKGRQSFYVTSGGEIYFLFTQDYKVSNKKFFQNGINVSDLGKYSGAHSASVRKTLDKLPSYIRYIEREFGIAIYERTKEAQGRKRQKAYKRERFLWRYADWEVA